MSVEGRMPKAGRATARGPREIELKFDVVDLPAARALVEGDAIDGLTPAGPLAVVNVTDRYVDTASRSLHRAGWVGRLRIEAGGGPATLALKSASRRSRGAVHVRDELEGPADVERPPAEWAPSSARDQLLALARDEPLTTTVVIDQRRRQRRFCDADVEVEVSLDRVRTLVGERIIDRSLVLEVELKGGSARRLEGVGEALARLAYLSPSGTSKLERAAISAERWRLQAALPDLATVKSPGVATDDLVGEAGRKVLAFHFARMLAKEAGTREGRDPEELHQMRVATRRMRAAWRVFGEAFDPRPTRAMRSDLRDLAAALGTVRDLDVLLDGLGRDPGGSAGEMGDGLGPFVRGLQEERDEARRRLVRLLERPGYHRWISRSVTFLTSPGTALAPVLKASPRRIRETAPSRVWLAYEQVRAYGELLRWADVPTLHELRIAGKRLRYSLEFIHEALGPAAGPLLVRVTALQDHLGLLNDADVAAQRARAFLIDRGSTLSPAASDAIGRFVVEREREVERLRRTVGGVWRGVEGPAFRRLLGRAVARL